MLFFLHFSSHYLECSCHGWNPSRCVASSPRVTHGPFQLHCLLVTSCPCGSLTFSLATRYPLGIFSCENTSFLSAQGPWLGLDLHKKFRHSQFPAPPLP